MWTYEQKTGRLSHNGMHVGDGYSGHGPGLNNPDMEAVHNIGPIPCGLWSMGPWYDHPVLGPCVTDLTPIDHDAHGRTEFRIHGDNEEMNHTASHGCIIMGPAIRNAMRISGDSSLTVIKGE